MLNLKIKSLNEVEKNPSDIIKEKSNEEKNSIFSSSVLDELEKEFPEYTIEETLCHIKQNKYKLISHSKIDNILIFYKVLKNEFHFVQIHKDSVYYQRKRENYSDLLKIENYFINLKDIEQLSFTSHYINIKCKNKNDIQINCFHNYHYTIKEEITTEEHTILEKEKNNLSTKLQILSIEIMKRKNIGITASI